MRISDWSSDVCSSDLADVNAPCGRTLQSTLDAAETTSGSALIRARSAVSKLTSAPHRMPAPRSRSPRADRVHEYAPVVHHPHRGVDAESSESDAALRTRSEERRVGEESVNTMMYRGEPR